MVIVDDEDARRAIFRLPGGLNGHAGPLFRGRWKR
jgi:hypothetical protein